MVLLLMVPAGKGLERYSNDLCPLVSLCRLVVLAKAYNCRIKLCSRDKHSLVNIMGARRLRRNEVPCSLINSHYLLLLRESAESRSPCPGQSTACQYQIGGGRSSSPAMSPSNSAATSAGLSPTGSSHSGLPGACAASR